MKPLLKYIIQILITKTCFPYCSKAIQLPLKKHGLELHTWVHFSSLGFFPLAYFIVRIHYITHVTYQVCVKCISKASSQQQAIKFWGSPSYKQIFSCAGGGEGRGISASDPCVVQWSAVVTHTKMPTVINICKYIYKLYFEFLNEK